MIDWVIPSREQLDFFPLSSQLGDAGWWFDTAALAPEETADRIIREAPDRALVN
ncbi:hypothetical protein AB0C33_36920 [Nonomuraea sp. NPDC048881]|uniref:hypothetical protein n=1 Tax=Nonomuraea sp. NPDC048881 TaxID=3155030 RepID=UPI0033EC1B02